MSSVSVYLRNKFFHQIFNLFGIPLIIVSSMLASCKTRDTSSILKENPKKEAFWGYVDTIESDENRIIFFHRNAPPLDFEKGGVDLEPKAQNNLETSKDSKYFEIGFYNLKTSSKDVVERSRESVERTIVSQVDPKSKCFYLYKETKNEEKVDDVFRNIILYCQSKDTILKSYQVAVPKEIEKFNFISYIDSKNLYFLTDSHLIQFNVENENIRKVFEFPKKIIGGTLIRNEVDAQFFLLTFTDPLKTNIVNDKINIEVLTCKLDFTRCETTVLSENKNLINDSLNLDVSMRARAAVGSSDPQRPFNILTDAIFMKSDNKSFDIYTFSGNPVKNQKNIASTINQAENTKLKVSTSGNLFFSQKFIVIYLYSTALPRAEYEQPRADAWYFSTLTGIPLSPIFEINNFDVETISSSNLTAEYDRILTFNRYSKTGFGYIDISNKLVLKNNLLYLQKIDDVLNATVSDLSQIISRLLEFKAEDLVSYFSSKLLELNQTSLSIEQNYSLLNSPKFANREKAQKEIICKYGITATEFIKNRLANESSAEVRTRGESILKQSEALTCVDARKIAVIFTTLDLMPEIYSNRVLQDLEAKLSMQQQTLVTFYMRRLREVKAEELPKNIFLHFSGDLEKRIVERVQKLQ